MKAIHMIHPTEQTYSIFGKDHQKINLSINVEHQGHFTKNTNTSPIIPLNDIPNNERLANLIRLMGDIPDIHESLPLESYYNYPCKKCGQYVTFDRVHRPDAKHIQLHANSACTYPQGRPDLPITLSVPSGKIFIANDLRDLADGLEHAQYTPVDMNIITQEETRRYAQAGILYWFVDNTCPEIYHPAPNTIIIGLEHKHPPQKIGSIITDLWWVCAMDYDHAHAQHTKQETPRYSWEEYLSRGHIIDVTPGNYGTHIAEPSIDHTTHNPKPVIIQRIGDVTPFIPPTPIATSSPTKQ